MPKKTIIVGLGNPGREYENTYHNAGFLALESVLMQATKADKTPKEEFKKYKNLFDFLETDTIVFVWPLTFMNNSGKAIREVLKKFNSKPENLIVIHDDSDIIVGNYKISSGRSSAGHKGVQSIIDVLGTNAFTRVRIGIRPAREKHRQKAGEFALKQITAIDKKKLAEVFKKILPYL